MTRPSDHEDCAKQGPGKEARRRPVPGKWRAALALAGLVAFGASCGGANGPATGNRSRNRQMAKQADGADAGLRAHAQPTVWRTSPDPTPVPGGGAGFRIIAGPGSDLNHDNPRFVAADQACK